MLIPSLLSRPAQAPYSGADSRRGLRRFLRSRKATHEELSTVIDTPIDLPGPDAVVEAKELKEQILKEIDALSEKNRLVTMLYFINGYSHKEIGMIEFPSRILANSATSQDRREFSGVTEVAETSARM